MNLIQLIRAAMLHWLYSENMFRTRDINVFVSALLSSLSCGIGQTGTSTHAPLIPTLTWVQVERGASRLPAKGAKAFNLVLREATAKGTARQVTVIVPAKTTIADFYAWAYKNIPIAIDMITPNGCSYHWGSRAVPHDEETDCLDEAEGAP